VLTLLTPPQRKLLAAHGGVDTLISQFSGPGSIEIWTSPLPIGVRRSFTAQHLP
jgi:hypothetical protein